MAALDRTLLAEKVAIVERHLLRVVDKLPASAEELKPATDVSDAVILHLWQAVQVVIDVALSACLQLRLGTPTSYRDAFVRLAQGGYLDASLAERVARAAGFRNVIAHAYDTLDMQRVFVAAQSGPGDLRAVLAAVRDALPA